MSLEQVRYKTLLLVIIITFWLNNFWTETIFNTQNTNILVYFKLESKYFSEKNIVFFKGFRT